MAMREIKFRGKDKATGKWLYGDFTHRPGKGENEYSIYMLDGDSMVHRDVDLLTVGQYTELKDVNGNEIYKDDVVEWQKEHHGVVIYNKGAYWIQCMGQEKGRLRLDDTMRFGLTIIGNIHDKEADIDEFRT
jgi:uncharacterized phage protein (TIGR01671 family)